MPHVILFEHGQFHGAHKHVFRDEPNLNADDDNFFNDRTSSIVVLEGRWVFFENSGFNGRVGKVLEPGLYPDLNAKNVNIPNDVISSLRPALPGEE